VEIVEFNPGIFSENGEGWGQGRISNLDPGGSRTANSVIHPAHRGQTISLLVTGMGIAKTATVSIGGRSTQKSWVRATSRPGVVELLVQVPTSAAEGCFVPVYLEAPPKRASNVVTMAIRSSPGPCEASPFPLLTEKRIGLFSVSRTHSKAPREGAEDLIDDDGFAMFVEKNSRPIQTLLPPPGTCTEYLSSFQSGHLPGKTFGEALTAMQSGDSDRMAEFEAALLDAGAQFRFLRLDASKPQSQSVRRLEVDARRFRGRLGTGGSDARRGAPGLILDPGATITARNSGGDDVPPFSVQLPLSAALEWVDREQIKSIDRSQGVTVHWKGAADSDVILIVASNVDQLTTGTASCICSARPSAGSFEIPAMLLANFPASQEMPGVPYDRLYVASAKVITNLRIQGVDTTTAWSVFASGRVVTYR